MDLGSVDINSTLSCARKSPDETNRARGAVRPKFNSVDNSTSLLGRLTPPSGSGTTLSSRESVTRISERGILGAVAVDGDSQVVSRDAVPGLSEVVGIRGGVPRSASPISESSESSESSGSEYLDAPAFQYIYHKIYLQILGRVHEALHHGVDYSTQLISNSVNARQIGVADDDSSTLQSESALPQAEWGANGPAAQHLALSERNVKTVKPAKTRSGLFKRLGNATTGLKGRVKKIKERTITALAEWQIKKILVKPKAREELARAIALVFIKEVKQATSLKIHSVDIKKPSNSRESDASLNDFTRVISPILFHLAHQACLSGVYWSETEDGRQSIQNSILLLIEHILQLSTSSQSQVDSDGNKVDGLLGKGVASALQSGKTFMDKKLEGVESQCIQQIVDEALVQLLEDGIDLTSHNFDEVLARVKTIITDTLILIHADIVQTISDWYQNKQDDVESERKRLIEQVESVCSSILKKHGTTIAKFFGTSGRIVGALNDLLDEFIKQFREPRQFREKLDKAITCVEPLIVSGVKSRLNSLKLDVRRCRDEGRGFKALVDKIVSRDGANRAATALNPGWVGLAALEEVDPDSDREDDPDRWSAVRQALPGAGSRLVGDMTGLVLGELRDNLETVRSVLTPHINTVMTEVVNQGAAFVAQHHDNVPQETLPGFTQAVTPSMTTLVVELLSRKLLSEAWEREITDEICDKVEQALTPNGDVEESADGQSQESTALGRVMDRALGSELAEALRQGGGSLQSVIDELPFTSLQQLTRDFVLHSAGEGATWLDQRVSELFAQDEDEQSIVSTIMESITQEVVSIQDQLVQGVAHWMQESRADGSDSHRQVLINLLSGRARSLVSPLVMDGASLAGQEPEEVVRGVVPYLQQQLARGQTFERLAGYGVDWLSDRIGDHTDLIRQDVEQQVRKLLAEATPELEAAIHKRLAALRDTANTTRRESGSVAAFVQQAAKEVDPEPEGDPERVGLAALEEVDPDSDREDDPDRWSAVRQALPGAGSRLVGDMTGLVLGELRDNLETVRSVLTPHINTVMTEVVNQGAAFVAQHYDNVPQETLPGFTQAVTPSMTTLVVELLSRKLLSEAWEREITDEICDKVEQALTPNGDVEESADGQSQESTALGRVMDRALGSELAEALRQGGGSLQSVIDELPFTSLQQLTRDFVLHSAGEGATWLDQRVSELFAQDEDEQSIVSTIMESITQEVVSIQDQLVQGVAHWMQESRADGSDSHRQVLINLLSGRARSLVSPLVMDGASLAGQEPEEVVRGVVPYLQQQLARGQTFERLAGYGVDWLSDRIGDHTDLIRQDVEQQVRKLLAEATPELEAAIHKRLAALRDTANTTRRESGSVAAFVQQAAKEVDPEPEGDPERVGLAALEEVDPDSDREDDPNRWSAVRQALPGAGSRLVGDMTGLVLGELRDNLETVRSVLTPHINTVMTEVVNQGAAFVAQHHDNVPQETLPGFTQAVTPSMTTLVVELLSRKLLSEAWEREITDEICDKVEQALTPNGDVEESADGQSQESTALGRVMDRALGSELAEALRQGGGSLQSVIDELPFTSLQQLTRDFVLHSAGEGATWLDQRVSELFAQDEDEQSIVSTIMESITQEVVSIQDQLVQGVAHWMQESRADGSDSHRQVLINLLSGRARSLVSPLVMDGASLAGQEPEEVVRGVVPYLQQQLARGQTFERLAGYGVDWLSDRIGDHTDLIRQDVEQQVRKLLAEATPELEAAIHKRLAALRDTANTTRRESGSVAAFVQQAAKEVDPEPEGDPERVGLAALEEVDPDSDREDDPNRWSAVRQALPGAGSRLVGDMTGLVLGELRDNLETVRSVLTPHINTVMTEVVNQGAAFVAQHHDNVPQETLPGFTQAVTPSMTTLVVELLSRKLLSEAWEREITDEICDKVEQALTPNGDVEESADGQSQESTALGRVMDRALGSELAEALRQGGGSLQSVIDELPFTSLQQLTRDFVLHSAGEGATWLDQRVSELFSQDEDEQSIVSTIMESITQEVVSIQDQLVQGVAHWMQESRADGSDSHRQVLINLLSGRARSLVSPLVMDGASLAGQEPEEVVRGVVPYLQQQLARGQTFERLAGYGVDWLSDRIGDHTDLIRQDVEQQVRKLLAEATPELEAAIHKRLAALRDTANTTRRESGSVAAFVQQAAKEVDPEPEGDPERVGLAALEEVDPDSDREDDPDRWSAVRQALPGAGSRLVGDMTGLVLGELRDNLETVRSVLTPHINTVMTEVVNQGAAFVAQHHDNVPQETLPGFTQAVTPSMTTLVVELLSRKLLSEAWEREITDEICDKVEQALTPNGDVEESADGQSQESTALGRVMDRALGSELAEALRQGGGSLQSVIDELPFTSLQQLTRDFVLHSAGEGATWLDQRVSELFSQDEDEQSIVSTIMESITQEVVSIQDQLVQGVAHWMQESRADGSDSHRQVLINLLSGRARSLVSPLVMDGASLAGQEPEEVVRGVVPYLQQQLARGQTFERLAGYGVDWLSDRIGDHTDLIRQDVEQQVRKLLAEATPELEAAIHKRLAALRDTANTTRRESGSVAAFVQQAAKEVDPEPEGDPERVGLAALEEVDPDSDREDDPDRWSAVRQALPGAGSRLVGDMTGLVLGELRDNLETVRSVLTPHINTVMTEVVNQGAAFVAQHHDNVPQETLPGFTQAVTPSMTTLVVELLSRKLLSEAWEREITDEICDKVEQALTPNGDVEESADGQSQESTALGRVMDRALGSELAEALRQGGGSLQSVIDELPFTSLQQLTRDFVLHSAGEGATWLDQRVSELFSQDEDEQSIVSTIMESITQEVVSIQDQLVQGVAHWMQESRADGSDSHRQVLINLLSGRARSLVSPLVMDGASLAGQEPEEVVRGVVPYLQQQLARGQTFERLAGYGVDWLSDRIGDHTDLIRQDVEQQVRKLLAEATPELEAAIHKRLAALRDTANTTRRESGSVAAFVQQAAKEVDPEPEGDPERVGLAALEEVDPDSDREDDPDRWSAVRQALPGAGSRLVGDMTGLVLGELRDNLETVRSVLTPHINTVMTEVVNQGAAFVAQHHDNVPQETLPGFTQAVTPSMTTLVVELLSRKLLSEAWEREITDEICDKVEQALTPNGDVEESADGQSQESTALGRVMDRALGSELAEALRQGGGSLQSVIDELPFTSLQQLTRDFVLHSAGEGATWLDQRVSELFSQDEDEQSIVSTIMESITQEVVSIQDQLVQGVAHWMQESRADGSDSHRQVLINLLSGRARSLVSPLVMDGASLAGQEPEEVVRGVVPYLQQQLARGQTFERLAGYGVDWLSDRIGDHTDLIRQDVEQQVRKLLAEATPELEAAIHKRLAALRDTANTTRRESGSVAAFVQQAAKEVDPEPEGDPERVGLAALEEVDPDSDREDDPDRWSAVRQALPGAGSRLVGDMTGLVLGELRDNLETVRSVLTPHINTVMTEVVNQGAAFVAQHHDNVPQETLPGFTQAVTPSMTTLVVELLSRKLLSEAWEREITDEICDKVEQALTPNGDVEESADGQSQESTALGRVMDRALGSELAEALRQGGGSLQSVIDELPFTSLQQLTRDFVLHSAGEGATWLDQRVSELFSQDEDEQSIVSTIMESITQEVVSIQDQLVQGVAHWMQESRADGSDSHRQVLINLLSGRARSLVSPLVMDGASLAGQEPEEVVRGVVPYLQQQLARGQTFERLAGYGVDWLSDRIGDHTDLIRQDVEQQVRKLLAEATPELEAAIHKRLAALRDTANTTRRESGSVAAFVQQAAKEVDPDREESACRAGHVANNGTRCRQAQWMGSVSSLIPSLGKGGAAVIKQIANTVSFDDSALHNIDSVVQEIVTQAVGAGAGYVVQQNAEPSDGGNVKHIGDAVTDYVKHLASGSLSKVVQGAVGQIGKYVNENEGSISDRIESTLRGMLNGGASEFDLVSSLTPHINSAIDQALNQGMSIVKESVSKWVEANTSAATPELNEAIDKILTHIMANGGEWFVRNQKGIDADVIGLIQDEIIETIQKAQADVVQKVAIWLSNETNLSRLVLTLTNEIRTAVTNVVVSTVAKQVSGKDAGAEFERTVNDIAPYIMPIVDQALAQTISYTVRWFSGWVQCHGQEVSSLINPFINKTVQDLTPSVRKAAQDKALLLAQHKAQDVDFNKLAAELAKNFSDHLDLASHTSGVVKVGPNTNVAKELPKILCFLMQSAETYECLGGNLNDPIEIDHLEIDGREFNNIRAELVRKSDGTIQIRCLSFVFRDADNNDMDIKMTGVSFSYQLPEKSKLYKAALLCGVSTMSSEDSARSLFDSFVPESISINVDQVTGEFHDDVFDGPNKDTIGFALSNLKFTIRLHKHYPKLYMDVKIGQQETGKPMGPIKAYVKGHGFIEYIDADIHIDQNRNGYVDVKAQADPAKLNRLTGWLIGGKIHVVTKLPVKNGTAILDDVDAIGVSSDCRLGWFCNALLKNTLKANNPGFVLGDDGKGIIKLKLTLLSEERSNPITRWLAKGVNRILQFFTSPIDVRVSFNGDPYAPVSKGEKGLGSFNGIRFVDGLFTQCSLSVQSDAHEELLRGLRVISSSRNPQAHIQQLDKVIDYMVDEFKFGNAPSDLSLVREVPLESLVLFVNHVKHKGKKQDLARLLFLIANLVKAVPEKAVKLLNSPEVTSELVGKPYLLHLVSTTPKSSWLKNPKDGTIIESVFQDQQFKRLREYWRNSQSSPDGCIYSPGTEKCGIQEASEKAAEMFKELSGKMDIPDAVKLMMSEGFDFKNKMFSDRVINKHNLTVRTPASQPPYCPQSVMPVNDKKRLDWPKHRYVIPQVVDLSNGNALPAA